MYGPNPFPDFSLRRLARTSSTQDVVRRAAVAGASEGFCCVADEQSEGRGRHGRPWSAPRGSSLLTSILLRRHPALIVGIPFAAGLAMIDAIAATCGVVARLKWPNDVMVDAKKLAGILAEAEPRASSPESCAVAVGTGVNLRVAEFPPGVTGVSLHELTPPPPALELLDAWVQALGSRLEALGRSGVAALVDDWRRNAAGLGEHVRAVGANGEISGVAMDIAADGALLIKTATGVTRVIAADVHLSPRAT